MRLEEEVETLAAAFSALPCIEKGMFLARVAHMQTIHARAVHADNPADAQELWRLNELIHRLCGYAMQVLSRDTDTKQDASVTSMIVNNGRISPDELWRWLRDLKTTGA
jgi:hypothetical protein